MDTNLGEITSALKFSHVLTLDELDERTRQRVLAIYCRAFAGAPYYESITPDEAAARLRHTLERGGDLLLGGVDGTVASFAGGYPKPDGIYYIEELAVAPEYQRQGLGRRTFDALLQHAASRQPRRFEGKTAVGNRRARALYESAGFAPAGTEVVPARRQGGVVGLDERLHLSKPSLDDGERLRTLKRVAIAYPGGNATALVFDQLRTANRTLLHSDVVRSWQAAEKRRPAIEQCGFVTLPRDVRAVARVEMFGGEFSGNATRSAAWLVTGGQNYVGLIEASGVAEPLWFQVKDGLVTLEMPVPIGDHPLVTMVDEGVLVRLDGIAQIVVDIRSRCAQTRPRHLLAQLLHHNTYGLAQLPAVGVSYYDKVSRSAEFCVWVRDVGTIVEETACGSGTCAIGVASALAWSEATRIIVTQPSGEAITTEVHAGASLSAPPRLTISGRVAVLHDGEIKIQ